MESGSFISRGFSPATFKAEERTVEITISTETPVLELDWEYGDYIPTILAANAIRNMDKQVPLLNTHSRKSIGDVIGSVTNLRYEEGSLIGTARFADTEEGRKAMALVEQGHLTDLSIGFSPEELTRVSRGEKFYFNGRTYGDDNEEIRVITRAKINEASFCPIGADENSKVRNKEQSMSKEKETKAEQEPKELERTASENPAAEVEQPEVKAEEVVRTEEPKAEKQVERKQEINQEEIQRKAIAAERARVSEISDICRNHEVDADEFIKSGATADVVRKQILEKLTEKYQPKGGNMPNLDPVVKKEDGLRSALENGMLLRQSQNKAKVLENLTAEQAKDAKRFASLSLNEMVREALRGDTTGDRMEDARRALSTSDFPIAVSNVANKFLLQGFEATQSEWRKFCSVGTVNDFRTHTAARRGEFGDLQEIAEGEGYKFLDAPTERKEEYSAKTYGGKVRLTRQMIINDDLQQFTDLAMDMGELGERKLSDLAFAQLTSNPTMGDGTALFHASHGNLGSAAAIGIASFKEALVAMGTQKDITGKRRLNIRPQFIVAPYALQAELFTFLNSQEFGDGATDTTRANPYYNRFSADNIIFDSRLDDASAVNYYFLGNPNQTIKMFFLGGQQSPVLERVTEMDVDGVCYKMRLDAVAKAMDWKAAYQLIDA